MEFVLLKKLAKLEGTELWMFIGAIVAVAALIAVLAVLNKKHVNAAPTVEKKGKKLTTRMLVQGALCIALAFVLSYIKLFSMPMGGSITLFSMLPIFVFAWMYGPAAGLLAGFAYSLLQVVQGAYVVHPVQFVLDYFLSFTVLGLAGFFPKSLALGAGVGGFCRMLCGVLSGAIFFADSAAEAGYANAWAYSFMYNFTTIGVDTILCVIAAFSVPILSAIFLKSFIGRTPVSIPHGGVSPVYSDNSLYKQTAMVRSSSVWYSSVSSTYSTCCVIFFEKSSNTVCTLTLL